MSADPPPPSSGAGRRAAADLPPDAHAELARTALARARDARAEQDAGARLAHLDRAREHALASGDAALLATACWRLAKGHYDAGEVASALDALDPLLTRILERDNFFSAKRPLTPFSHYPAGLSALEALSRAFTDRYGYTDARLLALWDAAVATRAEGHDPYLTARARIERAWLHACTGQHDAIAPELERYARMAPADFGQGPTRHPRAADAPSSLIWVTLDLARAALWCATWRQDDRAAWYAREALEDAAEEAQLPRHADVWHLDAVLHAGQRFGWDTGDDPRHLGTLLNAKPLPPAHQLRLEALHQRLAGQDATAQAHAAAHAALEAHAGPEWAVQATALATDPTATARLTELCAQYGVYYQP